MRRKKKIHFADKREYIRLRSVFPVEFRVLAGEEEEEKDSPWQQGYTCNVSEGGICLETVLLDEGALASLHKPGALWQLRLRIPLRRPPIEARARVAWVRRVKDAVSSRYLVGLRFCHIAHSDADRLVSQARWFSVSKAGAAAAGTFLVLALLITGLYGWQMRRANERLIENIIRIQEEETQVRAMIDEIGAEKQMLSRQMKKISDGLDPSKKKESGFEALAAREKKIADRLVLLERRKQGLHETIVEKMHQWLRNHQNPLTGLVLSFEGEEGIVQDWAFIYDQALAANVFLLFDNERDARRILNFFKQKLSENFQGFPNAYYYDSGEVAEHTVHCGPNIWVGVAVLQYWHKTGDDYYLPLARRIADWLMAVQEADPAGGLKGGPAFSWFATEHNLDAYAFFGMLYEKTKEDKYLTAQQKILSWLKTYALIPGGKDYAAPPVNRGRGDATIATDTFAWSLAALGPQKLRQIGMDPEDIMNFAEEHCGVMVSFTRPSGVVVEVSGFDFAKPAHVPRGGVVSPEWTSQMIVSYQILNRYLGERGKFVKADAYAGKAKMYLDELNKLIISSPSPKGQGEGCLPYATLEDADTGHGWQTPRGTKTCSVAGTAYMMMAIKEFNPLILE